MWDSVEVLLEALSKISSAEMLDDDGFLVPMSSADMQEIAHNALESFDSSLQ